MPAPVCTTSQTLRTDRELKGRASIAHSLRQRRAFASPNALFNLSKLSVWWLRRDIEEVDDGIWLVSFMHYDLGYFDLEQKTLQPLDDPFGARLSPMS